MVRTVKQADAESTRGVHRLTGKKSKKRERIDVLLLERGLAESLEKAQALVMARQVRVGDRVVDKAGTLLLADTEISLALRSPYVGRGGAKLAHALEHFGIEVTGLVALDVGASTGGFTDCLLQSGASRVYSLDVGKRQLHYKLRKEPRVVVMEGVNAHHPFEFPEAANVATVDVSFISLAKVLPNVVTHLVQPGRLVCLVKPQFEARREQVQRGGVVKDPLVHGSVLAEMVLWAIGHGLRLRGITTSPLLGDRGNREFFVLLEKE